MKVELAVGFVNRAWGKTGGVSQQWRAGALAFQVFLDTVLRQEARPGGQ